MLRRERIGQAQGSGIGIARDEAQRVRLEEAGAHEHVLDEAPQALALREAAEHRAPEREREGDLLEAVDARDLLDQVDLPRDVAHPPGGNADVPARDDVEPEALEDVLLLLLLDLDPDDPVARPVR